MSNYTYTLNGKAYTNEQIHDITDNYLYFHFGLLRIGSVVYTSQWINTYECCYTADSTHETETAADLRIAELITKRMQTMSKPELEQVEIMRKLDKDQKADRQLAQQPDPEIETQDPTLYQIKPNLSLGDWHAYNYRIKKQERQPYGLAVFIVPVSTVKTSKPVTGKQIAKYCTWILKANLCTLGD